MILRRLWALPFGAALLLGALGCSRKTEPPPEQPPKAAESAPALRLSLAEYIPAPGLRWLIHLRPRQLLEIPGLKQEWARLLGAERIRAFALVSGIEPRAVEDLWIAGYDLGTLYVFDGQRVDASAERAFRSRAMSSRDLTRKDGPLVHVTGMIESTPHALVRIPGHVVAMAEKDVGLARLVRGFAEGKLKRTPSALQGSALSPHHDFQKAAPVRGFFVGPFQGATDVVVNGAASGAGALTWTAGELLLNMEAYGVWPKLPDLSERMTAWAIGKLDTAAMRAVGFGIQTRPPQILCQFSEAGAPKQDRTDEPDSELVRCAGTAAFPAGEVADSLYRLLAAPTSEMFRPSPSSTSPEAVEPNSAPSADSPPPSSR